MRHSFLIICFSIHILVCGLHWLAFHDPAQSAFLFLLFLLGLSGAVLGLALALLYMRNVARDEGLGLLDLLGPGKPRAAEVEADEGTLIQVVIQKIISIRPQLTHLLLWSRIQLYGAAWGGERHIASTLLLLAHTHEPMPWEPGGSFDGPRFRWCRSTAANVIDDYVDRRLVLICRARPEYQYLPLLGHCWWLLGEKPGKGGYVAQAVDAEQLRTLVKALHSRALLGEPMPWEADGEPYMVGEV